MNIVDIIVLKNNSYDKNIFLTFLFLHSVKII